MIKKEWQEAVDMRQSVIGVGLVILLGAVLRLWALGSNLPFAVGIGEPDILERAVAMMKTGDFSPHSFRHPGLYIHLQLLVACVRFVSGAMQGLWRSLDQVSPADFYVWGRATTAILGTGTVLLVHRIGFRWGSRHALLAAGLMAVAPLHVGESRLVTTDVPMTFFITLTLLLSLRVHEKRTVGAFAAAGAAAGLAAATNYNGVLALILPLLAAFTASAGVSAATGALATLAAWVVAFLVAAPYTFLDLPAFLNGVAALLADAGSAAPTRNAWLAYLQDLQQSLGWPVLLLTLGGLGLGLVRSVKGPGHVRWLLLVVFPVVAFWRLATGSSVVDSHLLPVLPFVCVLAAIAVISGVSLLRRFAIPRAARTALIVALTTAAVAPPLAGAFTLVRTMGRSSTYALAGEWMLANLPHGARIAVDGRHLRLPPAAFRAENLPSLVDREYQYYVNGGVEYLVATSPAFEVASNAPQSQPEERERYRRLVEQTVELQVFTPSEAHPGPELRVLQVRR